MVHLVILDCLLFLPDGNDRKISLKIRCQCQTLRPVQDNTIKLQGRSCFFLDYYLTLLFSFQCLIKLIILFVLLNVYTNITGKYLYEVWHLFPCGKQLHDHIISLIGDVWGCLTPSLFIELPISSQESELSYICVIEVSVLSLSLILLLDLGTVPTVFLIVCFNSIDVDLNSTWRWCSVRLFLQLLIGRFLSCLRY